ncbi:MAG: class IV adenylate cyclase [Deltaproteobacteria bacterium]|nr:class IV adenylate cyclase [Deltaproteobacteria bacterium]
MPRNIEIKARVADLVKLRSKVLTLAPRSQQRLAQRDTFFPALEGRLKLRCFGDGSGEIIAYSRTDSAGPKESAFQKVACADPAAVERTLSLALGVRGVVEKRREVFLVGQTRVHLDEVVGLGSFLELEVVLREDQTIEGGDRIARELLSRLEISSKDLIAVSYIDLLEGDALEGGAVEDGAVEDSSESSPENP